LIILNSFALFYCDLKDSQPFAKASSCCDDIQATAKQYQRQIDQLVYKLYGLTDEEIKIVEGKENI